MEWFTYLLKVSTCLGLFYAIYYLLLQKLTFFSFNRCYLMGTLVLSFVIPALQLQLKSEQPDPAAMQQRGSTGMENSYQYLGAGHRPPAVLQTAGTGQISAAQNIDWTKVLHIVYWSIAALTLLILAGQVAALLWHSRKVVRVTGPLRIVSKRSGFTNCSFLHYVFVDQEQLSNEALAAVLQHEGVHAARYHSVDKLIVHLCRALLWFSPPIYFYSRAIEQVHEYEADRETSSAIGSAVYANLLLTLAVSKNNAGLVHSFVRNPVKERIRMLFTNQSKNRRKLTYLTLVPAGLALVWLFGVQVVYADALTSKTDISENRPLAVPVRPASSAGAAGEKTRPVQEDKPADLTHAERSGTDTLRLVNSPVLGKNPVVIIDGKKYNADILMKISPASCKSFVFSPGQVVITTKNNKIEYAAPEEFENARNRSNAASENRFYARYPVKIEGRNYDEIRVRMNYRFADAAFPEAYKAILLIDGKSYTEAEARKLPVETGQGKTTFRTTEIKPGTALYRKYGDEYQVVIEVLKSQADTLQITEKIFRRPLGLEVDDAYGKFSYSAKDSTVYNEGLKYVILYGDVKMTSSTLDISADKIKFNGTTHVALAKNVSFIKKGDTEPIRAAFARFDMYKGSYEILPLIKDL